MSNNTELSAKRIGEIGLHIVSFDEMTREKFSQFFRNVEEVDFAIDDHQGFVARATTPSKTILDALSDIKQNMLLPTEGAAKQEQVIVERDTVGGESPATNYHALQPANVIHSLDDVVSSRIETIITDKGVFFHIDALKDRLESFTTDQDLFMKACADAGVDIFTEYVSEAAKKKISKSVQDITKELK